MAHPLYGARLKVKWAEKHIDELHFGLKAFAVTEPYIVSSKIDPNTHEPIYYISKIGAIPPEINLVTADILQNLRTALDHMACALIVSNRGTITKQSGFPIFDDGLTSQYQSFLDRKVNGMRQEAIDDIAALKPYKGGNDILWRLNRLNNLDKHRLVFTVGAALLSFNAGQHLRTTIPPVKELERFKGMSDHWVALPRIRFPLENGTILLRDFPDAKINQNIKFMTQVAFNEPGICEGEFLIVIVRTAFNLVRKIVRDFDCFF
jgi:hypothetical protein